jgi:hypothetical protein
VQQEVEIMFIRSQDGRTKEADVTDEAIANRAYELWQQRGCPDSDGADDWQAAYEQLQAKRTLPPRHRPLKRWIAKLRNRAAL